MSNSETPVPRSLTGWHSADPVRSGPRNKECPTGSSRHWPSVYKPADKAWAGIPAFVAVPTRLQSVAPPRTHSPLSLSHHHPGPYWPPGAGCNPAGRYSIPVRDVNFSLRLPIAFCVRRHRSRVMRVPGSGSGACRPASSCLNRCPFAPSELPDFCFVAGKLQIPHY